MANQSVNFTLSEIKLHGFFDILDKFFVNVLIFHANQ